MSVAPLAGVAPGSYIPIVFMTVAVLLGVTPPSGLVCAFKLGAGSDLDSAIWPTAVLVANATVLLSTVLYGLSSATAFVGAGSTLNATLQANGQAVTCKVNGTRGTVWLFRGQDS
jgi:hypothetical protein